MSRTQHEPKYAVAGVSLEHFTVDSVTVREDVTETNAKSCQGDESLNIESCSQSKSVVKRKSTVTVFKSPQQLRVIRPVDRLPIVFEDRQRALLAALSDMKQRYRQKGNRKVRADVTAAQLEKLLTRFNAN